MKAWYTAQIFPPPGDSVRQVNTISWYLWKVGIFRVPLNHPTKGEGRGRMGPHKFRGEMQYTTSVQDEISRTEDGNNNRRLDEMENTNVEQESAVQGTHTEGTGVSEMV